VHDFEDEWQIYDDRKKSYIPYIDERHNQFASHTVFFEIDNYRGYKLLFYAENDNYLFINGSLRRKVAAKQWIEMSVDSLYNVYKQPLVYLTMYGTTQLNEKKIQIGYQKVLGQKAIVLSTSLLTAKPRESSTPLNYLVFTSTLVLLIFVFLFNNYNRAIEHLYNFRNLIAGLTREHSFLVNRPLSGMNLLFVGFLSILISFIFVLLRTKDINPFGNIFILSAGNSMWVHFNNFVRVGFLVFGLMLLKYFYINFIGGIFGISKATNLHFFKIVQASLIFFSIIFLFSVWLFSSQPLLSINFVFLLLIPLTIFYFLRTVLIFFMIKENITIKNLYLFSYLCIVEIVPVVIGVRFAS
jgi:hypothetical protein